jgi:hypothetical protein
MIYKRYKGKFFLLDLLFIFSAFYLSSYHSYNQNNIFQHFDQDFFQLLGDSFRELKLSISNNINCILDLSESKGDYYISWGPATALLYAIADSFSLFLVGKEFPKVLLFLINGLFHSWLVLSLIMIELKNRTASYILTFFYLQSFPMYFFFNYDIQTEHISTLYGVTYLLAGLYFYRKSLQRSNLFLFLSGLFLGLGVLTRISYWIYAFVFSLYFIGSTKIAKRGKVFILLPICTAVIIFFSYNYLRFGELFNFGERYNKYHGLWTEVINDMRIIPMSWTQLLIQIQEMLNDFFDFNPRYRIFDHSYLYNLYLHYGPMYFKVVKGHYFGLLAFFASFYWLRDKSKRFHVTCLLSLLSVLFFWFYHIQMIEMRYLIHFWPLLFVLSCWGLGEIVTRVNFYPSYSLVIISLLWLAFGKVDRSKLIEDGLVNYIPGPMTFPDKYTGEYCYKSKVSEVLQCSDIYPITDLKDLNNIFEEDDYHRLGIYRTSSQQCEMLFFSGATMKFIENSFCKIELTFDEGSNFCEEIDLYISGDNLGRMTKAVGENGKCVFEMHNANSPFHQTYFYFHKNGLLNREINNLMNQTQRFPFQKLEVSCSKGYR